MSADVSGEDLEVRRLLYSSGGVSNHPLRIHNVKSRDERSASYELLFGPISSWNDNHTGFNIAHGVS